MSEREGQPLLKKQQLNVDSPASFCRTLYLSPAPPSWHEFLPLPIVSNPFSFLFNVHRLVFPVVQWPERETGHWPQPRADVKNEWRYISTVRLACMTCTKKLYVISGFRRGVNGTCVAFGILRSVDRWLFTDVSGQPIGPIFKGRAVQEETTYCAAQRNIPKGRRPQGDLNLRINKFWLPKIFDYQMKINCI